MKVTINWLKDYLKFDFNLDEMLAKLTMHGIEVETIEKITPSFTDVVTAKILSIKAHPKADNLKVCEVFNGKDKLQIVCGASNMQVNDAVLLANINSSVSGKKIEKAKIREVESFGMLCSEKDLQIGFDNTGLRILPSNTEIGRKFHELVSLSDIVVDLGITPNRGDCLSIRGVAREIAATYGKKITPRSLGNSVKGKNDFNVYVSDAKACSCYGGAIIHNVKVRKSDFDLIYRLYLVGIRSINNIVDITNFILWDTGQPMHAFDLDKLKDNQINVRYAKNGEKILTLDGVTHELKSSHLVIADKSRPVALAGVMGGEDTSVDDNTKKIFFESACFNPVDVRKTSKELGIASDSSYRFERGIDIEEIPNSLLMACKMSEEIAGAAIINSGINLDNYKVNRREIPLRLERCSKILGFNLKSSEIADILGRIDISKVSDTNYSIPGYRNDVEREIDLIEEISRVYGYEKIPLNPEIVQINYKEENKKIKLRDKIRTALIKIGLNEVINYSFVSENDIVCLDGFIEYPKMPNKLANPLSPDQGVMRNSLIPGLIKNFVNSNNYKIQDIKFFEIGAVFPGMEEIKDSQLSQDDHFAMIIGEKKSRDFVGSESRNYDFYDLKGLIDELFTLLNIKVKYATIKSKFFSQCCIVSADSCILGVMGEADSSIVKNYDSKAQIFACEFSIEKIINIFNNQIKYSQINRLPFIMEDISFIADEKVSHDDIKNIILQVDNHILENIYIFDIFKGKNIPKGKKSMAYSLTYRDSGKTLTIDEVNKVHNKIKEELKVKLGVEIR
ncbi:MAG: hypothetical protein ACD_79C00517G0008 [uncultured bacterium]|nr:MAG: hypothetical protein ACD_79C00517G0008 [uncultured bacterium]